MKVVVRTSLFLVISIFAANALKINPPPDAVLETFTSNIQYESIQFQKRAKNDSLNLVLNFAVSDVPTKEAEILLLYNNESIAVGKPGDRTDVYAEKQVNKDGLLTGINIYLKNTAVNSGLYTLFVKSASENDSADAKVLSAPILPVYSKPKRILQGDPLRISCRVSGFPLPDSIKWLFAPIPVDLSDDKTTIFEASDNLKPIDLSDQTWKDAIFSTEGGTPNDTLRFDSISISQNGLFACNASNNHGSDSTFLLVGVKDRWAALWPFIGIVVEVTVLVAAILLYERHQLRKKPTVPESTGTTDATSPNSNPVEKNSKPDEVRLRNTRA
ncbi:hypothetical protein Aperf_G00000068207 [Anoplocephala perfoliata]